MPLSVAQKNGWAGPGNEAKRVQCHEKCMQCTMEECNGNEVPKKQETKMALVDFHKVQI